MHKAAWGRGYRRRRQNYCQRNETNPCPSDCQFLYQLCWLVRYISPKYHTDLHINPFQLRYWLMRYITVSTEQVSVWDRWLRMDAAPHRCGQVWKRVHRNKRTAVWLITTLTRLLQQSFVCFPYRSFLRRSMDPGLNFLTKGRIKNISMSYCYTKSYNSIHMTDNFGQ